MTLECSQQRGEAVANKRHVYSLSPMSQMHRKNAVGKSNIQSLLYNPHSTPLHCTLLYPVVDTHNHPLNREFNIKIYC